MALVVYWKNSNIKAIFDVKRKSKFYKVHQVHLKQHGVYEILCGTSPRTYIGQTNRRAWGRVDKHSLTVRKDGSSGEKFFLFY